MWDFSIIRQGEARANQDIRPPSGETSLKPCNLMLLPYRGVTEAWSACDSPSFHSWSEVALNVSPSSPDPHAPRLDKPHKYLNGNCCIGYQMTCSSHPPWYYLLEVQVSQSSKDGLKTSEKSSNSPWRMGWTWLSNKLSALWSSYSDDPQTPLSALDTHVNQLSLMTG